jgi:hypothetical protein
MPRPALMSSKTGRPHSVRVAVIALVAAVFCVVFVAPWIAPSASRQLASDSQALGFDNRIAVIGLAAGVTAMFVLARRAGRGAAGTLGPRISTRIAPKGDRVSPRILALTIAAGVLCVAVLGTVLQNHPFGDATYFIDRLLQVGAGGVPYSQIEFSYGPLLIWAPLAIWRLFARAGLSVYALYYCWVAICCAAGLAMTAFLLNRIQMNRSARNAALLVVAGIMLSPPTLLVSYSPLRFLLPLVVFIWVMGRLVESPGGVLRSFLPLLSCVVVAGVSPDMGVALLAALGSALSSLLLRGHRAHIVPLLLLLSGAALIGVGLATRSTGTLQAFAGGAYWLPILPGLPALAFVCTVLLLAWGVGGASLSAPADSALHVGWLTLTVILIFPALGRADFGHVFWNGLGAILVCIAVVEHIWGKAGTYLAAAGAAFMSGFLLYTAVFFLPAFMEAGVRRVLQSRESTVLVARVLHKSTSAWTREWERRDAERRNEPGVAARLASIDAAAFVGFLPGGQVGTQLAASANRIPLYYPPGDAISAADFRIAVGQIDAAKALILPKSQLKTYQAAAIGARPDAEGIVLAVPTTVGGRLLYGVLLGVPATFYGKNAVFDPAASFGALLQRDWALHEGVGEYAVLVRRRAPGYAAAIQ